MEKFVLIRIFFFYFFFLRIVRILGLGLYISNFANYKSVVHLFSLGHLCLFTGVLIILSRSWNFHLSIPIMRDNHKILDTGLIPIMGAIHKILDTCGQFLSWELITRSIDTGLIPNMRANHKILVTGSIPIMRANHRILDTGSIPIMRANHKNYRYRFNSNHGS